MRAILDAARGAVALSEDRPADALARLREASDRWRELDASYETAQVGVRIGEGADHSVTRRANGDPNDLRTARRPADASLVLGLLSSQNAHLAMLSPREFRVMRLLVRGGTNVENEAPLYI